MMVENYLNESKEIKLQPCNMPSDFKNVETQKREYENLFFHITKKKIKNIANIFNLQNEETIFLSIFLILLKRHTRQNIITIGYSNELEKNFPISIDFNLNKNVKEVIEQIDKQIIDIKNDKKQILYAFENFEIDKIHIIFENCDGKNENYDLKISLIEEVDDIKVMIFFNACYFEKDNMTFFQKHYNCLLKNVESIIHKNVDKISLIDEDEKKLILNKFNDTNKEFEDTRNVIEMIVDNANKFKEKEAIIYENESITYWELEIQSNILAQKLLKNGIKKGDFVVLLAERGIEMVLGILAIMKSGAAYVPIDPSYPEERIEYIIKTCEPKAILTYKKEVTMKIDIPIIAIKKVDIKKSEDSIMEKNIVKIEKEDYAYCIFTSGTTGKPKGVILRHKGLSNLVKAYENVYGLSDSDVLLQFASIAFDQSVWDIFTILTLGGTLCLISKELINEPRALESYMVEKNVTVTALTPAYIKLLNPDNIPTLKVIESGSAAADYDVMKKWKKNCRVFNTYGPTEATVNTLSYEIKEIDNRVLPIGKPIQNVQVYIINNGELCGIGEPGELCIAGYGVSAGYLKLEEKNKQSFIDNPFGEGKMYLTGDLAKWRFDGNIVCLGRIDDQIKIRGFRIELGEIENCLKEIPYIDDVYLLIVTKDDEKEIQAFIKSDKIISSKKIKEKLLEKLPDYMIPSYIYQVDEFPLTLNGKLDKKKLQDMIKVRQTECVEPSTEFEKKALDIFKEVLMEDNIGITDDFYDIGGTSIKAITIISKLREQGYNYAVCDLLKEKTIQKLGRVTRTLCTDKRYKNLEKGKYDKYIKLHEEKEILKCKGISYLTPTQVYMLEAYRAHIVGDNFLQYFYKCPIAINEKNLKKAINLLPIKNEALTTMIIDKEDKPIQVRYENRNIEFSSISVKNEKEMNEICKNDVIRGFDFENDTLIRFKLFKFPDNSQKLLCSLSHIMVDGWSVELIIQDLSNFYIELENGVTEDEILKKIRENNNEKSLLDEYYKIISEEEEEEALKYWKKYFEELDCAITIPYDNNSEEIGNWDIVDWIGERETEKIKKFCKNHLISENTFFELAYAYLIALSNKKDDVLFSKVISGRDIPLIGIDNMIGMLINIIPQKITVMDDLSNELKSLNEKLLNNSRYDKIDFYHNKINNKNLMDEGKTIFVFSSYYELAKSIFEYEFDRDQDDVDMSFFVDSMKNMYHIIITCKKSKYTRERLEKINELYRKIIKNILNGEKLNGLSI